MLLMVHLATPVQAAFPENVDLFAMTDFGGDAVFDQQTLKDSYNQLIKELGTVVANKSLPASSLGTYGFDVDLATHFVFTEGHYRQGEVSPWARASADETSEPYRVIPTLTIRKGLPLSTEVGASFGWISGSSTGTFGAYGKVAVLQGYRPVPDLSLKIGYSGYVGNDQLDLSVLDAGVTVGTTIPIGRHAKVNTGKVMPFASVSLLRVTANPTIDEEVEKLVGAVRYTQPVFDSTDVIEPPLTYELFGVGVQVISGVAHLQVSSTWSPTTVPTVSTSFGFSY